ncbi:TusE/DsrC/DsvC family sulfur relay protein [Granulosicoccaceae sp. 1_MG-2023]|nr:TusE/DsrC/DsvC family sulfur relay protein [Granulosicoccaceae sp. 1_MG-2023]
MTLIVDGQPVEVDEDGYLKNRSQWNEAIAEAMAAADGIELSANHWEVLRLLQNYYEEYQIAPNVRVLTKQIGKRLGKDKGNSLYLYELFPRGPALQACRYAGLPRPTGCS